MPTRTDTGEEIVRGDLAFRPASLDDAAFAADVATALRPDEPKDPAAWRHWWQSEDPEWTVERFVVRRGQTQVGYLRHAHAPWEKLPRRYGKLHAELFPAERTDHQLTAAFDFAEERSRAAGAEIFATSAREDDERLLTWLLSRGYRRERQSKAWELDLIANRNALLAMAERSRARMREQGIAVHTIDRDEDPDKFHKIHRMSEEAADDVPTTIPYVHESFETFMKWFESPTVRLDRMWIAREGDDIVGISVLAYPPTRGNVWTDWTGSARRIRGRGVARALKLETVVQAIELGVPRVRTENDGQNAPILHLNEEMGYTQIPGWVQLMRESRS